MTLVLGARAPARDVDYRLHIKPLLAEKCSSCHGRLRQEAGLRLDHGELARRGGDHGKVIDVDDAAQSKLLARITSVDVATRMPPAGEGEPLTEAQILLLTEWISAGARSPDDETVPAGPNEHWAWQSPERPALPTVPSGDGGAWSDNPIDGFVYAELKEHGLQSFPRADRRTLLRRLYLDLIGLPPTLQEQQAFLADSSPDAWLKVVNRLLADPAFGERWARHWMDVWRYSDWDGYKDELRGSQRHIWRWRDWIVESLNEDKGYDRMIVEMLAGDELAPTDPDVLRATGFLARNYHNSNRNIWLDATVEHSAKALIAMTINCARCHDHKYDPISQEEYYAFRAIFEPHHVRTERLPGEHDTKQNGLARVFDAQPEEPTFLFVAGNEKMPDKDHPVGPAVPSLLGVPLQISPIKLPVEAVFPALRSFVETEEITAAETKLAQAQEELGEITDDSQESSLEIEIARQGVAAATADLASLLARWKADKARYGEDSGKLDCDQLRQTAVLTEHEAKTANARLVLLMKQQALAKAQRADAQQPEKQQAAIEMACAEVGDAQSKLDALAQGPDQDADYTSVGEAYPATSTGRRLALARWIVRPENPLTARVAVNYIWMHHFGEPLVGNVFDFGFRTAKPPHLALLDWLAVEFMEHDWSLKHLHRVIVTSRTYQLASSAPAHSCWQLNRQVDPDNRFLWRANVRRLDAEVIRDSLLHVAGNLNRTMGGPDIDFKLGETIPRRSIYFRHAYEKQMKMLVLFDAAGPMECYRRRPSIIPQQALALANGPLIFDQARRLAAQLTSRESDEAGGEKSRRDDASFVRTTFQVLLCRNCSQAELETCMTFLTDQAALLDRDAGLTPLPGTDKSQTPPATQSVQRARENLIHALMNHNDFVTVR